MKRIKQCFCIIVVFTVLLAIQVNAQEMEGRSSSYIAAYDSYIHKNSSHQIQVWFNITGMGTMDKLGVSEIIIQRSPNGTDGWITLKRCYPEEYPQMLKENDFSNYSYVTYTCPMGYYYRAIVTFYSQKGNGFGEIIDYAEVVKL